MTNRYKKTIIVFHFCLSGIKLDLKRPKTEGYFLKNLSIAGRGIFFFEKRVVG